MKRAKPALPTLGELLGRFFGEWMVGQGKKSPRTVSSYRDTWRLYLGFLAESHGIRVPAVTVEMVNADTVLDFLDHIAEARGCCTSTRNQRLAAIRSFSRFVVVKEPAYMAQFQRILSIPTIKPTRKSPGYLTKDEMTAVLEAPDRSTPQGRRDHTLLLFMYNTGARVSETVGFCMEDLMRSSVLIRGKGSTERTVPVWGETSEALKALAEEAGRDRGEPLFANLRGEPLTRHGVAYILRKAAAEASSACPTIDCDKCTPHVIRHTTAMHLLQSGVDINLIRMWLGHVGLRTVHVYAESDVDMMRDALQMGGIIKSEGPYSWSPDEETEYFLSTLGIR